MTDLDALLASLAANGEADGHPCWCRKYDPDWRRHDGSCPVYMRGDALTCGESGGTMPDGRERRCTQPEGHDAQRQSHTFEFTPPPQNDDSGQVSEP